MLFFAGGMNDTCNSRPNLDPLTLGGLVITCLNITLTLIVFLFSLYKKFHYDERKREKEVLKDLDVESVMKILQIAGLAVDPSKENELKNVLRKSLSASLVNVMQDIEIFLKKK